jgi:hypothetical protein
MSTRRTEQSGSRRSPAVLGPVVSLLAPLVVVTSFATAGHPTPGDSTVLALLLAVTLATVALTRRASAAAVRVDARPAGQEPRAATIPGYVARQCDPDAAGRPRPRAPGCRQADLTLR